MTRSTPKATTPRPTIPGRLHQQYAGRTTIIAPVQTEAGDWKNYLSEREQRSFDHANRHWKLGGAIEWGGLALMQAKLIVGATVAPPIALLGVGLFAYGMGKVVVNGYRAYSLKSEARRREGEIEVMRRCGVAPRDPQI